MMNQKTKAKPFARSERATARKAAAILVSISIAFTGLCLPCYASAAAAGGKIAWQSFWYAIKGALSDPLTDYISSALLDGIDKTVSGYENIQNEINKANESIFNLAQVDEPVQFWVSEDGLNYGWQVNSSANLSADELATAEYMVNWLNTNYDSSLIACNIKDDGYMSVHVYETAKELAAKAYTSYLADSLESAGFSLNAGDSLASTGDLPVYSFDFVGPKQGLTIPSKTGSVGLVNGDFTFTSPVMIRSSRGYLGDYMSTSEAATFMASLPSYITDVEIRSEYEGTCFVHYTNPGSAIAYYIIYNNKVYYSSYNSGGSSGFPYYDYFDSSVSSSDFSRGLFISSDGEKLSDLITSTEGLMCGICFNTSSFGLDDYYSLPHYPSQLINTDDFTAEISGGETEIPLSDDEQAISNALGVGLLTEDSQLTLDENGNITAADGISIAKLNDIIEMLKNGTLEFEDVQSYLQTISQLVANGNLTAQQQKALLDNVNTKVGDISGDISKINENIASIAKALELDKTQNLDFEVPSTDLLDKFPFSIPFDFYNILTLLVETPKEPVFYIKLQTDMNVGGLNQSIDESIKLDLTVFKYNGYDIVRMITNSVSVILFSLCLISGTKKLIWK